MNMMMTMTLIDTTTVLKLADCLMPEKHSAVITATMSTAGKLTMAPVATMPAPSTRVNGALLMASGMCTPIWFRKLTTYPDQPTDTVAAAKRYSSTSNQPTNQATPSPNVAYEYEYALPETGIIAANSA